MSERNMNICYVLIAIVIIIFIIGTVIIIREVKTESYCNSLELAEYLENKECRRIIER